MDEVRVIAAEVKRARYNALNDAAFAVAMEMAESRSLRTNKGLHRAVEILTRMRDAVHCDE